MPATTLDHLSLIPGSHGGRRELTPSSDHPTTSDTLINQCQIFKNRKDHCYPTVSAVFWFCFTSPPTSPPYPTHASSPWILKSVGAQVSSMNWYGIYIRRVYILPCSTPKCELTVVSDLEVTLFYSEYVYIKPFFVFVVALV